MKRLRIAACAAGLLALCASAGALEFKSVGSEPAVLYDAPSQKGRKVFVAPRGMPVEVVLTYGEWTKIRDAAGDLSWIESRQLQPRRMLTVKAPQAVVRVQAEENAAALFRCDKGVLLELAEPAGAGWLKVRHRDGQTGYIKAVDVWGA